jgi:hypothetical protein
MEMLYYNVPDKEIVMYTNDLKGFFGEKAAENRPLGGLADLMMEERGARLIQKLISFKAGQVKNDAERRQGLHGPYEEVFLMKTGRLPDDYYEAGDDIPWGLRVAESRSSILWQVLSGILDHRPEFAAAYMAISMDLTLDETSYERELKRLNQQWRAFNQSSKGKNNHQHRSMSRVYGSIACPSCSILTAMICQDEKMNEIFRNLLPLDINGRRKFLESYGLGPLLHAMIPDPNTSLIVSEQHFNS